MFDIDKLTIGDLKQLQDIGAIARTKAPRDVLPFGVGDAVLVRTVTMILVGRVKAIGRDSITMEDGGWIADTGRFSKCLADGTVTEFEQAPSWFLVGRGAIVDVFPWAHELPKATK